MKMTTKTFPAGWVWMTQIDRLVNTELRDDYSFVAWTTWCAVYSNGELVAECPTPPAMQYAFNSGTSCTFSVTLPAEWWK